MASIKDLEGRWRLTASQGFEEYMKELGVGLALRKMGAMAKPDCVILCDGNNITVKTESTLKTTQFSCTLGEKFDETTADGRKTQTICTFTNGALVQHQNWDGKESTITRRVKDGKLVVDCCHEQCHLYSLESLRRWSEDTSPPRTGVNELSSMSRS